jgi:hypothetical protein
MSCKRWWTKAHRVVVEHNGGNRPGRYIIDLGQKAATPGRGGDCCFQRTSSPILRYRHTGALPGHHRWHRGGRCTGRRGTSRSRCSWLRRRAIGNSNGISSRRSHLTIKRGSVTTHSPRDMLGTCLGLRMAPRSFEDLLLSQSPLQITLCAGASWLPVAAVPAVGEGWRWPVVSAGRGHARWRWGTIRLHFLYAIAAKPWELSHHLPKQTVSPTALVSRRQRSLPQRRTRVNSTPQA